MRIKAVNFLYLILGVFGFKSTDAMAEIIMCSPSIQGDVTAPRYVDCIDVSSWQWGSSVGISRPSGQPVQIGNPVLTEISISKSMDSSSVDLANLVVSGNSIKSIDLFIDECPSCTVGDTRVELHLMDVYISSYSQSTGGDLPSESVSLNYGFIEWCYRPSGLKQELECGDYDFTPPNP